MALVPNGYEPKESPYEVGRRSGIAQDGEPTEEQKEFQAYFRSAIAELAFTLNSKVEDSDEKAVAITKLEEALLWAGKAIFR